MTEACTIRVESPWFGEMRFDDILMSSHLPVEETDALLCDWAPSEEVLLGFPRRKAWYNCEPEPHFVKCQGGGWPAIRAKLQPHEFLHHKHPDARYRVPHITHLGAVTVDRRTGRHDRAVAVVSNFGGSPRIRFQDAVIRNRFILQPTVDLFGRRSAWRKYRARLWSLPRLPRNFRGEIPGDWDDAEKRGLLAQYKVCVCLENSFEPFYFTEKFVDAAAAGCVPVYRAHPTVAATFLAGAKWIEPGADEKPRETINRALAASLEEFQEANAAWLATNPFLKETSSTAVYHRIGRILAGKDEG
jgi:hypothetical protein